MHKWLEERFTHLDEDLTDESFEERNSFVGLESQLKVK